MSKSHFDKIIDDLQYIYPAVSIPLYLYQDGKLACTFPSQCPFLNPPDKYLLPLLESSASCAVISTSFFAEYGILQLQHAENCCLIAGPAAPVPYSQADLMKIFHEYSINQEERNDVISFLDGIPNLTFSSFQNILKMLHHFLNESDELNIVSLSALESEALLREQYTNELFNDKEYHIPNNSLELERIINKVVENGDIDQIKKGISQPYANIGTLSKNTLRNVKNQFIVYITLLTRSAIKGGVSPTEAFKLSDLYIQKAESTEMLDQINQLFTDSAVTLTTLVAQTKQLTVKSSDIGTVINYVRQHTNRLLTVSALAKAFGYSSNYLSAKFKKELGFSLSSFITRTKLEEARLLLKYTDKSLLEISEYLCFSSQSHFQKAFKKQYGITPLQYRKTVSSGE